MTIHVVGRAVQTGFLSWTGRATITLRGAVIGTVETSRTYLSAFAAASAAKRAGRRWAEQWSADR